jgi:hypothetical protein
LDESDTGHTGKNGNEYESHHEIDQGESPVLFIFRHRHSMRLLKMAASHPKKKGKTAFFPFLGRPNETVRSEYYWTAAVVSAAGAAVVSAGAACGAGASAFFLAQPLMASIANEKHRTIPAKRTSFFMLDSPPLLWSKKWI